MQNHTKKEFIENARKEYFKIGSVVCPAFNGEKVYFTERGLNHLLFKNGKQRTVPDQYRRIKLLKIAIQIVRTVKTINSNEMRMTKNSYIKYYVLTENINKKVVKVIIIREKMHLLFFLSVMDR
ncbi:MAG: hypothetical protein V4524_00155 [Patescibacteria group bacterium]